MKDEDYEMAGETEKGGGCSKEGEKLRATQEQEPQGERRVRLIKQLKLILLVTLSYFSLGTTLTWPSPAISSLSEDNSTLFGTEIVLSSAEKDMTGSLLYLGTLIGAWASGIVVGRLGRRISLQIIAVPYLAGWLTTGLAPTTAVLLIGRFVLGVAGGGTTVAGYAYVVEIPDVSIRGNMAVLPTLGVVLGNLYTVALGYYFPWHHLCFVAILPTILYLIATFFLPESPSFLIVQGRKDEAFTILKELRGKYINVEEEIENLEQRNVSKGKGMRWLLRRQVLQRVMVVGMLFLLMQMCGNFVFMIYTARILEKTGAPLDPDAITAIAGVLRVVGTATAVYLLDKIGRRLSLIVSHAINASTLIVLGTFVYLAEAAPEGDDTFSRLSWVPTLCVMLSLFICDLGVHPVPYVLSSEYFPTNIRAQASSICISAGTFISFVALQLYSPLEVALTQAGLYWFYGAVSALGVVFCYFAVIETKGKAIG